MSLAELDKLTGPADLLVIGGGANGAGIARDAAGRGLSVVMCEKDDLAQGTSSRSGKLIHGGLRYLEYYEFRLVREALIEREVVLNAAPHIVWPMRFVLPHSPDQRPRWLIRLGLFLYDHLGGRAKLPGTRSLDFRKDPEGAPIVDAYPNGFEYSDCWVDDARLVVLNALDAKERGAVILTRTPATSARREGGLWEVELTDTTTGETRSVKARAIINAAGPWIEGVLGSVAGVNSSRRVRLVKGSHLIFKKWWQGSQAYLLQNDDKRVIFVNPYEGDLALIGTTDIPVEGRPEDVRVEEKERSYLLRVLNRYFRHKLTEADIVAEFSGVRPLYDDDSAKNASAVTRDYVFDVDPPAPDQARAPLLSIFGGKITTYRKLAEHALDKLQPYLGTRSGNWTARAPLPGGDMPGADFDAWLAGFRKTHPWLPENLARHYGRRYGTRSVRLLEGATRMGDLGRHFGGELYEREVDYLVANEWARSADDILTRRTKHYLHLSASEQQAFRDWFAQRPGALEDEREAA
ncbi:MAG TPA: glycerol-3-phosphate dehydrogenase [Geminicoccus sp.]|uniref:glycerol-3-phosphate dehydrogenase n=1 Tax=Geminicoccus sp. TaxID=2024832 RepID=UPI002C234589|nr:glycerol-3-phosphate dehydrogenase [Geminicoccus sp.]HWL71429.1 glycerol-3-phosphate dehydrogenase [Geminicoccus sp.]